MFIKFFLPCFMTLCVIFCVSNIIEGAASPTDHDLTGKHIAILIGEGFHDGETFIPMGFLSNLGAKITVIGVNPGLYKAYNSNITAKVHKSVNDVSIDDFDALIIPGGRSPDWLRQYPEIVEFTKNFFNSKKPVAAICHGPQVLVTAGVLKERKATCFPGMSDELKEAGAEYHDVMVLRDANLITSRIPDDIPIFSKAIAEALIENN